ncbi:glycoprotein G [Treponema primitia ZAS-2]|uniref:Glycoprotein G n=1 Tax=Treponema primitia (strain ATCC BAA-887 / DSM 12427 / ZAS-2) TaxID=545694 RepID=F5YIE1_TREPZ|nr:glycoprotein G [Treponema primitia ZAS-2]
MALYPLTKGDKGGDTIIQTGSRFPNSKAANPGGPAFPLDPHNHPAHPICANTRRLPMASGALAVKLTGSEDCP